MATTRIMPLHAGKGRSVESALKESISYIGNPLKTNDGEWISSYECAIQTACSEFLFYKKQYYTITGRNQGKNDVIAYHVRQSFKPGEITPEEANRIGYELAARFTKGKHAFIVCTHTDKPHIHNHIIWNSTTLDYKKKFRDFFRSGRALRKISDLICAENCLSVIENPKQRRGKDYGKWLGAERPLSFQGKLRIAIDTALEKQPSTFEEFFALMREAGYEVSERRKHITFRLPEQKRPTRCDTLRGGYTEMAIRERIANKKWSSVKALPAVTQRPSLLIDIQTKMQEGKGAGYEHWAKLHNLKQMAQTLIYLQEKGLDDYTVLKEKATAISACFSELSDKLKAIEVELSTNTALQKHIVTYSKTRQTYVDYRKAGYSKEFKALHEVDIILHQAPRKPLMSLA